MKPRTVLFVIVALAAASVVLLAYNFYDGDATENTGQTLPATSH